MSKSIPQLTAKTSTENTDLFHLVRSNVDYKITYSDLIANAKTLYGNTIFVDSINGSDITGEVENPARPFATINGGHTAGAAYYTGGTAPSSTNIISMNINGVFTEDIALRDYYNYDINNSYITGLITDQTVATACRCTIQGKGIITSSGNVLYIDYESTVIVKIKRIEGIITANNASCKINIDCETAIGVNQNLFVLNTGRIDVINTTCSNTGASLILQGVAGTVDFTSCYLQSDNEILKTQGTASNSSIAIFRNCEMKTTGTNYDVINLTTTTGTNCYIKIFNSTLVANGTGNSIDAAQATNVRIYGSCQTNLTHDTGNVTLLIGTVANGRFLIDTNVV